MPPSAIGSPLSVNPGGAIQTALAHVGTVRSEVLVFSFLGMIVLNVFASVANYQQHGDPMAVVMRASGILVFLLGFAFYCYAYFRLPSSSQELVFTQQSLSEIAKTKRTVRAAHGAGQ